MAVLLGDGDGGFVIERADQVGPTTSFLEAAPVAHRGDTAHAHAHTPARDLAIANSAASTISIVLDRTVPPEIPDTNRNAIPDACEGRQLRGDCNQSGRRDVADAMCLLHCLFVDRDALLPCGEGGSLHGSNRALLDLQPDGKVDMSDAITLLVSLFAGAPDLESACLLIPECPDAASCGEE